MWWLAYLIIFGKRRSPCETQPPAEPADEPATTATTSAHSDVVTSVHTSSPGDGVDIIVVSDDSTRQDIIEALGYLNDTAKMLRRQGYIGTAGTSYARQHERINALLDDLDTLAALQA